MFIADRILFFLFLADKILFLLYLADRILFLLFIADRILFLLFLADRILFLLFLADRILFSCLLLIESSFLVYCSKYFPRLTKFAPLPQFVEKRHAKWYWNFHCPINFILLWYSFLWHPINNIFITFHLTIKCIQGSLLLKNQRSEFTELMPQLFYNGGIDTCANRSKHVLRRG